jgi:hypothetical protein
MFRRWCGASIGKPLVTSRRTEITHLLSTALPSLNVCARCCTGMFSSLPLGCTYLVIVDDDSCMLLPSCWKVVGIGKRRVINLYNFTSVFCIAFLFAYLTLIYLCEDCRTLSIELYLQLCACVLLQNRTTLFSSREIICVARVAIQYWIMHATLCWFIYFNWTWM